MQLQQGNKNLYIQLGIPSSHTLVISNQSIISTKALFIEKKQKVIPWLKVEHHFRVF